jgi:circadian clock protein KaiC
MFYSPDEFTKLVRTDIEENGTKIVMIDSVGGYSLAVREENVLERLHALTVYLQNMGVTSLLINEAQNIAGEFRATNMNASYLGTIFCFCAISK